MDKGHKENYIKPECKCGSCGFEAREQAAKFGYWEDPRWKKVRRLRDKEEHSKANGLVFEIRSQLPND